MLIDIKQALKSEDKYQVKDLEYITLETGKISCKVSFNSPKNPITGLTLPYNTLGKIDDIETLTWPLSISSTTPDRQTHHTIVEGINSFFTNIAQMIYRNTGNNGLEKEVMTTLSSILEKYKPYMNEYMLLSNVPQKKASPAQPGF